MQNNFTSFSNIVAKSYFLTATDTGVGKTYITTQLAQYFQSQGYAVGVLKPFSSGGREDAILLKQELGLNDDLDTINPLWFAEPLAPYAVELSCLEQSGAVPKLSLESISRSFAALSSKYDILLVEGIGGVLVPLAHNYFVADLIKELGIPALLVARAGLGTLNHTLLSIEALRHRQITVAGIILNGYKGNDLAEQSNKLVLNQLTEIPILAECPFVDN